MEETEGLALYKTNPPKIALPYENLTEKKPLRKRKILYVKNNLAMDGGQIKNLRKTQFFSRTLKKHGRFFKVDGEQKVMAPRKSIAFSH